VPKKNPKEKENPKRTKQTTRRKRVNVGARSKNNEDWRNGVREDEMLKRKKEIEKGCGRARDDDDEHEKQNLFVALF
jgi:hypothetical protein